MLEGLEEQEKWPFQAVSVLRRFLCAIAAQWFHMSLLVPSVLKAALIRWWQIGAASPGHFKAPERAQPAFFVHFSETQHWWPDRYEWRNSVLCWFRSPCNQLKRLFNALKR